ncbi:MAG: NUDIX domain-containing protein [bacterium]|nr:NUDIX domain-containing protein [bacterium]
MKEIKIKAMCLVEHERKLLLAGGYDEIKKEKFFRVLGGSINFGEKAEDALRREIKEELDSGIENLQFLTVVENVFTYNGQEGHEITFLYRGDLSNKDIYDKDFIQIIDYPEGLPAQWVSIANILEGQAILYPSFNYKKIFSELF